MDIKGFKYSEFEGRIVNEECVLPLKEPLIVIALLRLGCATTRWGDSEYFVKAADDLNNLIPFVIDQSRDWRLEIASGTFFFGDGPLAVKLANANMPKKIKLKAQALAAQLKVGSYHDVLMFCQGIPCLAAFMRQLIQKIK